MLANRAAVSPRSSASESTRQREIEQIVDRLIAKRGYRSAIDELLTFLHNLGDSLADPQNQSDAQEFKIWARAVQTSIKRHIEECTFEQRIGESDALRARGMGVRLD